MATKLTPLPEVERLSPAVVRILGGNPGKFTLQGTNTYLVGTGPSRLLIDTGEGKPSWIAAIERALDGASVSHVILTHWHPDHTGGVEHLLRLFPGAKVFKNLTAPSDDYLDIADGQVFEVEGAKLTAVHSPGHTVDHMALVLEGEDAMFTGDNVLGEGTAVFEDLGVYIGSLNKMKTFFGGRGYPGHGPVIADGPARIKEYISHRQLREDQVVKTLREGERGMVPMEAVRVVYREIPVELHPAAEKGVRQILAKLLREGKVVVDGDDRWRLRSKSPL